MSVNIDIIRESFKAVRPHADDFVEHFYEELFTRYPGAKALFTKTNMSKQRKAMTAALAHIVDFWDEKDHLEDYLFKMGRRHVKYYTEEAHFPMVADALLATFEFFFESQWNEELKSSWVEVYQYVQSHMIRGMEAERRKLQEAPKEQIAPSIDEMARQLAREAFKKALDEEASSVVIELARDKAKEILRKALEAEAKEIMRTVVKKTA